MKNKSKPSNNSSGRPPTENTLYFSAEIEALKVDQMFVIEMSYKKILANILHRYRTGYNMLITPGKTIRLIEHKDKLYVLRVE